MRTALSSFPPRLVRFLKFSRHGLPQARLLIVHVYEIQAFIMFVFCRVWTMGVGGWRRGGGAFVARLLS